MLEQGGRQVGDDVFDGGDIVGHARDDFPGAPFDEKTERESVQMPEQFYAKIGDGTFFGQVKQVVMHRGKDELDQEQPGNAEREAVHQGHIFFNHDHIHQLFDVQRYRKIGYGSDD